MSSQLPLIPQVSREVFLRHHAALLGVRMPDLCRACGRDLSPAERAEVRATQIRARLEAPRS